jgi:hypothetical protein
MSDGIRIPTFASVRAESRHRAGPLNSTPLNELRCKYLNRPLCERLLIVTSVVQLRAALESIGTQGEPRSFGPGSRQDLEQCLYVTH